MFFNSDNNNKYSIDRFENGSYNNYRVIQFYGCFIRIQISIFFLHL